MQRFSKLPTIVALVACSMPCFNVSSEGMSSNTQDDQTIRVNVSSIENRFSKYPLGLALVRQRGTGKNVIVVFEDPNSGYDKLLEKELAKFTDLTVFTFLYPILGSDSVEKVRSVWCSADRARVWEDWMIRNLVPPVAPADCKAKFIDPTLAFGRKLEITAVPTMFFSDGDRIDGSRSANEMNAKFKSYSLGVDDAIVTVNRLMRDSQLATDRTTIMRSQTTPPSNAAPADARGEQAKPTTRPARVPADLCDPCAMAAARMQMPGGCPYRENPCAAPPTDGNGRTSR